MNIIEMAREAGFDSINDKVFTWAGQHEITQELKRLTALVRQQALEEAAEICEGIANDNEWSDCVDAEKAIRALKEKT
jgi:hypothetical protein